MCYFRKGRHPLTDSDYLDLIEVGKYVRDNHPGVAVIPGLGADGQPDLIITGSDTVHNGLAIWFSESDRFYDFNSLSDKQLEYVKRMARRSYITIATEDYDDIEYAIAWYVKDKFRLPPLPESPDVLCAEYEHKLLRRYDL